MHERSLVAQLLKQVDGIRRAQNADCVCEVRVEIGPLSGVEPLQLAAAFDDLAIGDPFRDAELVMDQVPLSAECRSCDSEFEIDNFVFRCPTCDGNVRVTSGDSLQLVTVSLQHSDQVKGCSP